METILVRRDQFIISPHGIVHRPTNATFTPKPGDPRSGTVRLGQLMHNSPMPCFDPNSVERMMRQLWNEYVSGNPQLFATR